MKRSNKKAVEIDIRLEYLVGIRLIKYLFLVKYEMPEKYRIGKPVLQTIRASRKLKDLVNSESWKILRVATGRILKRECRAMAYKVKQRGV